MAGEWTDLQMVLTWVAALGAPYIVGKLMSYVAENFPKWHELPREVKFIVPMVLSVVIAVGATLLLRQEEGIAQMSPIYTMLAQAILFYLGSQQGYVDVKRSGYGRSAAEEARERAIFESVPR